MMLKCQNRGSMLVPVAVGVIVILIILNGSSYFYSRNDNHFLEIDSSRIIAETCPKFLSFAIDTSYMDTHFHKLNDTGWKQLELLTYLLSPAYLRLGGTAADQLKFVSSTERHKIYKRDLLTGNSVVYLTGSDVLKWKDFTQKSNVSFLFDLNVLIRQHGQWDSTNAEELLMFIQNNNFPMDFQLGNEPNSFLHVFNVSVAPEQLASDFKNLRHVLQKYPIFRRSAVVGPDVTRPRSIEGRSDRYLSRFLAAGGDTVDVITWHQYYLNGRTATLEEFINPNTFSWLPEQIQIIRDIANTYAPGRPVWLSETSSAYGGGAPGLSDRYVATFLWLDKLGVAARDGVSVVIRQSLHKGHYALLAEDLTPTPDFWVSFLYKNLVGTRVIDLKFLAGPYDDGKLRFYAHCTSADFYKDSDKGYITLFGLNLSNNTESIHVTGKYSALTLTDEFLLTPPDGDLLSKFILLNGRKMVYEELETITSRESTRRHDSPPKMPPFSIGFWVFTYNVNSSLSFV